jgi:hypothetical protein
MAGGDRAVGGVIPVRSLACPGSPLVLALQVQARCLRPSGLPVLEPQVQVDCQGRQAQPGAASTHLAAVSGPRKSSLQYHGRGHSNRSASRGFAP